MRAAQAELFRDKIELSLDGKQVFYLFFGGAVIASMVFVLGVMTGRRVESRSHADAHAVASSKGDPLAALDRLDAQSRNGRLAFRGALRGETPVTGLGAIDAKLAAKMPAAMVAPNDPQKDEAAKKAQGAKKAAALARAEETRKAEEAAKAEQSKRKAAAKKSEEARKAAEAAKAKQAASQAADGPKAETTAKKQKPKFTLQLSSFKDRNEADAFLSQIKGAGFSPYIRKGEVEGQIWFRVRLGRYSDYDAAVAAKKSFEAKQGVIAYVTRL